MNQQQIAARRALIEQTLFEQKRDDLILAATFGSEPVMRRSDFLFAEQLAERLEEQSREQTKSTHSCTRKSARKK